MKNEWQLKEQMCEIGRRLYNRGFAAANDGNITVRLNEKELLCTPTMVSKGFMKPDDLCTVDMEARVSLARAAIPASAIRARRDACLIRKVYR